MSEVLRLKICADSLPLVTLALGLAAADAIVNVANVAPDLRWPNDVLLNGSKCAGILVQLHDGVLIAGIGINVNHTSFPGRDRIVRDVAAHRYRPRLQPRELSLQP